MKKRKHLIAILFFILVVLAVFGVLFVCQQIQQRNQLQLERLENQYLLDVSVASCGETGFYGPLPVNYIPGQDRSIDFTVSNNGYIPVLLREVLLISVFDQAGTPVLLDGSPYTTSSLEILSQDQLLVKALEQHQAVYACEYTLDASANHTRDNNYTLTFAESSPYQNCLIRVDLLLFGKPKAFPHADWELLVTRRNLLENTGDPGVISQYLEGKIPVPAFTDSQEYHWETEKGKAILVDIGNMQDPNIVIPSKIWLSESVNGLVEDPIFGACYDVQVKGNAFFGNETLETVTFQEGVSVLNNIMWGEDHQGMFENCSALTAVNNIPNDVTSMEHTFYGCTSLKKAPTLPSTVQDLSFCFYECSSLTATPIFPEGISDLTECFNNCSALETVQPLPDSAVSMVRTFFNCSTLTEVPNIPNSLENMNGCFQNCEKLVSVPLLPDGITSMLNTFYNCPSLTSLQNFPKSTTTLQNCFYNCVSLETIPALPENCAVMNNCFYGCTRLSGTIELPARTTGNCYISAQLKNAFYDCTSLDAVIVPGCKNVIDASSISNVVSVSYDFSHTSGICEGCHFVNGSFDANGLTFVVEDMPEPMYQALMEILTTEVPDSLKACCSRLVFPNVWSSSFGGLYFPGSRIAYVRKIVEVKDDWRFAYVNPAENNDAYFQKFIAKNAVNQAITIYHELAHGYDYHSKSAKISDSVRWRQLHEEEGSVFPIDTQAYAPSQFREETFARAVACYFIEQGFLQEIAPGMYEYIDELFGDAA